MDVSVIIVSYNCKNFLQICIDSVLSSFSNISGEIIIIDNNSTDGTQKFLGKFKHNIRLIENNSNLGFARANNIGSANAKGKFLLFLNPDTINRGEFNRELCKILFFKKEYRFVEL